MSLQVSGLAGQVALSELHACEDDEALAFTLELEELSGDNRIIKLIVYPFHDLEVSLLYKHPLSDFTLRWSSKCL